MTPQWKAITVASMLLAINMPLKVEVQARPETPAAVKAHSVRLNIAGKILDRNPRLGRQRAQRIANAVYRCVDTQAVPELTPDLMLAVMFQESAARPSAVSNKGAIGLMQVMPYMYASLGMEGTPAHLELNVEAGCTILADNLRRLGYPKGVAAYFWGNNIKGRKYDQQVEKILRNLQAGRA